MSFQIYRQISLGESLEETINELREEGKIPPELADVIFAEYDKGMKESLERVVTGKSTIKANMKTYHYYDNIWTFNLENVEFKLNQSGTGSMTQAATYKCDTAKVIVVDAKTAV